MTTTDPQGDRHGDGMKMNVARREEFCIETVPDPCGIVFFPAAGDPAHRKFIPSLFRRSPRGLLPKECRQTTSPASA